MIKITKHKHSLHDYGEECANIYRKSLSIVEAKRNILVCSLSHSHATRITQLGQNNCALSHSKDLYKDL